MGRPRLQEAEKYCRQLLLETENMQKRGLLNGGSTYLLNVLETGRFPARRRMLSDSEQILLLDFRRKINQLPRPQRKKLKNDLLEELEYLRAGQTGQAVSTQKSRGAQNRAHDHTFAKQFINLFDTAGINYKLWEWGDKSNLELQNLILAITKAANIHITLGVKVLKKLNK